VEKNLQAFLWGRKYCMDAAWVEQQISPPGEKPSEINRVRELTLYQNEAYARSYTEFLQMVEVRAPALKETVARCLFKLMAYKDEYEVARLLTNPEREAAIRGMWEAVESVSYNLHPPLLRRLGVTRKLRLGPWFRMPLRMLARLKVLRGTPFDIFGMPAHRREERALAGWYRNLIEELIANLTSETLVEALELAALPEQIRGYERIKEESIRRVKQLASERLKGGPERELKLSSRSA
jgi:indolepyruvate ferredoxin oxidoreductase